MKEEYGAMLQAARDFIAPELGSKIPVGIVLGSGFSPFVDAVSQKREIPYGEIPYFRPCRVEGHKGVLVGGEIRGAQVAILQGRVHAYEGYRPAEVVFPLRVLALLGMETLILTNAAGGLDCGFAPGDLVVMEDHINLTGTNPLVGQGDTSLGPRFLDMAQTYSAPLRKVAKECARELNIPLRSGTYVGVLGPCYETPAEVKMMRVLGGDMVGMSSIFEAMAAVQMGVSVLGISCISNRASDGVGPGISHGEVGRRVTGSMGIFTPLLEHIIKRIGGT